MAYGAVYLLPVMTESTNQSWQKLKTAHRHFVTKITQYRERDRENWNEQAGNLKPQNRYIYGRLRVPTLDTMLHNQVLGFNDRFTKYLHSLNPPDHQESSLQDISSLVQ